MRHYGSPTRLLDFSRSPYVAAFFATADAEDDESAAIWAIDTYALRQLASSMLAEFPPIYNRLGKPNGSYPFSEPAVFKTISWIGDLRGPKVVVPVEPFRINQRMLVQQGLSLSPAYLDNSFEAALASMAQRAKQDATMTTEVIRKLTIQPSASPYVLRELHRMNVNFASLLPGLDGLARSLAMVSKIRATTVPWPQRPDWEFDAPL